MLRPLWTSQYLKVVGDTNQTTSIKTYYKTDNKAMMEFEAESETVRPALLAGILFYIFLFSDVWLSGG